VVTRRNLAALSLFGLFGLSLGARGALAQTAPSLLESYGRAKALVDAAVAAHGGVDALRAARQIRVTTEGFDHHRFQSRRLAPPYDSTVRRNEVMIDLARGRIVSRNTRGFPGGFYYATGFITDSSRGFVLNMRNETYTTQQFPPAAQQFGQLFELPQWYLLLAHEIAQPGARRYLGRIRLSSGTVVEAVGVPIPNGGYVTLGFEPGTNRLRGVASVGADVVGDVQIDTEFLDYRMLDGVLLPTRRVLRRDGEVIRVDRYTSATTGYDIPDSLLAPPKHFTIAESPPAEPVRELAPGVWVVRAGGSRSLVVGFSDHLLVVDAAPSVAPEVVARVGTLAPGKPVRYVVPTHHHDDHFGGVRHFAAAGATTVTTAGNVGYFRRVVSAPPAPVATGQAPATPAATVEAIAGKRRVFSDGARTVEIHDIGPSPHADEMLVAWLPAEGILFQGDLVEAPASGLALRGANAETTVHFADWAKRQGWNVRVIAGTHSILASPAELEKIARQPILPP